MLLEKGAGSPLVPVQGFDMALLGPVVVGTSLRRLKQGAEGEGLPGETMSATMNPRHQHNCLWDCQERIVGLDGPPSRMSLRASR